MKVLAKTIRGREFMYNAATAHKISEKSAVKIRDAVNAAGFQLNADKNEIWHIYEIDEYDNAFYYAENQSFFIYRGVLKARTMYY